MGQIMIGLLAMVTATHFMTGNELYDSCSRAASPFKTGCLAYVMGVVDATSSRETCLPANLTSQQARDIVVKSLAEHPEARDLPAAAFGVTTLSEAFCRK
jgi:hypothetical protein